MTSIDPTLSASLRLSTLSHLVCGPHPAPASTTPALVRLTALISTLRTLSDANKPLSRLLADWDEYAELLSPLPSQPAAAVWDAAQQARWLLTQEAELRQALVQLEAVDRLRGERGVLDTGRGLARIIETNQPKLQSAQQSAAKQTAATAQLNKRLLNLIHDWSQYTSTLSQAFNLLDSQLWTLERQLAAVERESS